MKDFKSMKVIILTCAIGLGFSALAEESTMEKAETTANKASDSLKSG